MKNFILSWASATMLLFNIITLQAQTTWTVDNTPNSGAQFTDVQSAINAASNGDTIYVQQSDITYSNPNTGSGTIEINKDLTIIGNSYKEPFYKTAVSGFNLLDGSSGTTLRGMEFGFLQTDNAITANLSNIRVSECKARGLGFNGNSNFQVTNVIVEGNELQSFSAVNSVNNITLRNNIIGIDGTPGGVALSVSGSNVLVANNIFFDISLNLMNNQFNPPITFIDCVIISPGGNVTVNGSYSFNNCFFYDPNNFANTVNIIQNNPGQTQNVNNCIFSGDPLFNTAYTFAPNTVFDFGLQSGSPLIGAGANGGDIGFQQNFIFKYLGNSKGYPEVRISNYTGSAFQNGTVTFDIEARSH